MKKIVLKTNIIFRAALLGAALLFFTACEESVTGPLGELNRNFADRTIVNAFLTYKDSGVVRMELKSPLIEDFTMIDSPYTIMRKGVNIKFWNNNDPKPNFLRADWAKMRDRQKFYEGKGNVEVINNDGDTMRTNHIFWDNLNRRIFTQDTVIIKRMDGTINISNHGMTATEDFKEFTFFDNHGYIFFEEDGKTKPARVPPSNEPVNPDMIEIDSTILKSQPQQ